MKEYIFEDFKTPNLNLLQCNNVAKMEMNFNMFFKSYYFQYIRGSAERSCGLASKTKENGKESV
jgi:hypothetical protein